MLMSCSQIEIVYCTVLFTASERKDLMAVLVLFAMETNSFGLSLSHLMFQSKSEELKSYKSVTTYPRYRHSPYFIIYLSVI